MKRNDDYIAVAYATESDGAVLAQDIWFFSFTTESLRRLWRQIQIWNGQFAGDPNYRWVMGKRDPYRG